MADKEVSLTLGDRLRGVRDNPPVKLLLIPITLERANDLVSRYHRHHKPVVGAKFAIGVRDKEFTLRGAAIVGRPVSRHCDADTTAEVTRLVTDGTKNACSMLYAACARACQAMGYELIQTYILRYETGVTLEAAGWEFSHWTNGSFYHLSRADSSSRVEDSRGCKKCYVKRLR